MILLDLNKRKKKKNIWTSLIETRRRRSRVELRCMPWIVIRSILILCTFLYVWTYLSFKALLWHFWHDFACTLLQKQQNYIYNLYLFAALGMIGNHHQSKELSHYFSFVIFIYLFFWYLSQGVSLHFGRRIIFCSL